MENQTAVEKENNLISVAVLGQEGDEKTVQVNLNEPCSALLRKGLHELYGHPGPNPDEYDLVLEGGKWIEPLSQKVADVGITEGMFVSILPKTISRG